MAAYVTGQKNDNNQEGVFPDNTADAFDNPRIEYLGEMLRRIRGPGFNVGIVTTADVTDSTPAANAAHTSDRFAGPGIAAQFFDERKTNGVTVLMGGGANHFSPKTAGGTRPDGRNLIDEFAAAGYQTLATGPKCSAARRRHAAGALLGLFHPSHMVVAFDKVGAGRYSDELALEEERGLPRHADARGHDRAGHPVARRPFAGGLLPDGGRGVHRQARARRGSGADDLGHDRVRSRGRRRARVRGADQQRRDPDNDTLVIVTADHECGGMAIIGVGNEHYVPSRIGQGRARLRRRVPLRAEQVLTSRRTTSSTHAGFPTDPNPSRKLLLGGRPAPDHFENWMADRCSRRPPSPREEDDGRTGVANPAQRRRRATSPGFSSPRHDRERRDALPGAAGCPADTASNGHTFAGHTATDVPLSATGPGAWQFTGVHREHRRVPAVCARRLEPRPSV